MDGSLEPVIQVHLGALAEIGAETAFSASRTPSGVSLTRRLVRSNSAPPARRSRAATSRLTRGWGIRSRSAVRPKCSSSARTRNTSISSVSMVQRRLRSMAATDVTGLLGFDSLLSDEERLMAKTVRSFVSEKVRPRIAEWFGDGTAPVELARELGALGLLGMHLHGYGCAGASAVAYGLACLELEAGDSGLRSFVSVQGSLAMYSIWNFGSPEQKAEW